MILNYKLKLKRKGRFKRPYFDIVVLNKHSKLVDKIGGYNPMLRKKVKKVQINIFLLYCWLLKGLKISFFLSKVIRSMFFY
jgi:ribosomal protein S16